MKTQPVEREAERVSQDQSEVCRPDKLLYRMGGRAGLAVYRSSVLQILGPMLRCVCHRGEEVLNVVVDCPMSSMPSCLSCAWRTAILNSNFMVKLPIETFLFGPWWFGLGALRPPFPSSSGPPRLIISRDLSRYGVQFMGLDQLRQCQMELLKRISEDSGVQIAQRVSFTKTSVLLPLQSCPSISLWVDAWFMLVCSCEIGDRAWLTVALAKRNRVPRPAEGSAHDVTPS